MTLCNNTLSYLPLKRTVFVILFSFILSAISIFAQDRDKPRAGEGIYSFLKRNNRSEKDRPKFIELNKGKFGKNNALILDTWYILPEANKQESKPTPNSKNKEPLFGKKHEEYTVLSSRLSGACFFLVSGHGGPDPGAISVVDGHELHEDEYAYDIMLRLARNLKQHGATVHIIIQDAKDGIRDGKYLDNSKRETCMGSEIPLNQKKRLKQRADKINQLSKKAKEKYQRAIFIHVDSRSKKAQTDVYFYHSTSTNSKKLAKTIRDTFESKYKQHQPNRGFSGTISQRGLYVLDNTTPVAVFAEVGNIKNTFDQKRFMLSDNRQAMANWFLAALITDFENSKTR